MSQKKFPSYRFPPDYLDKTLPSRQCRNPYNLLLDHSVTSQHGIRFRANISTVDWSGTWTVREVCGQTSGVVPPNLNPTKGQQYTAKAALLISIPAFGYIQLQKSTHRKVIFDASESCGRRTRAIQPYGSYKQHADDLLRLLSVFEFDMGFWCFRGMKCSRRRIRFINIPCPALGCALRKKVTFGAF